MDVEGSLTFANSHQEALRVVYISPSTVSRCVTDKAQKTSAQCKTQVPTSPTPQGLASERTFPIANTTINFNCQLDRITGTHPKQGKQEEASCVSPVSSLCFLICRVVSKQLQQAPPSTVTSTPQTVSPNKPLLP